MSNYELLWDLFMSDQMTAKELDENIRKDPEFESFVWIKIRELRNEVTEENK